MLPVMPVIEAMRHRKKVAKLGKPADQRKALMRSLTTEVIRHGRITTTLVRARAVRTHVDAMIGLAKDGSLHARRQALGYIFDKPLVHSLFEAAPERYGERNGGYCRVLRTMPRRGITPRWPSLSSSRGGVIWRAGGRGVGGKMCVLYCAGSDGWWEKVGRRARRGCTLACVLILFVGIWVPSPPASIPRRSGPPHDRGLVRRRLCQVVLDVRYPVSRTRAGTTRPTDVVRKPLPF
eukprot:TRINITY_DN1705_c0_g1_i2.p1 TRINITY_DN1705_c0_g1~~TRINITY_DN1705_c0_g1_i2.p1  ORF type:complete len:236 (+),score=24.04 TRINITY_DN1705_c0_g1_i2:366-1073(+)